MCHRRFYCVLCTLITVFVLCGCTTAPTPENSAVDPSASSTAESSPKSTSTSESENDATSRDGSAAHPLRLTMMPAEAGAADKTIARVQPILDAITKDTGLHFEIKFTDSYAGTLEGLATRHADIAQLGGPFVYLEARQRGVAELLAVAVREGQSTYYGAIFTPRDSGIKTIKDLKGHSCAFGDVNSMSSFNYPAAMMFKAGIDPSRDLKAVYLTNSHVNVVAALAAGKVEAGCCTIGAFESAAREGRIDPEKFVMIAKSDAIPGTPLVMYPGLPEETKKKLRQGYANLEKHPEVLKSVRDDRGRTLDKYDTTVTDADYDKVAAFLRPVNDDFKARMLAKAGKK